MRKRINYSFDHSAIFSRPTGEWVAKKKSDMGKDFFLYHYTSQETAFKILEGRKLWASDASFLNDSLEIQIGRQALYQALVNADLQSTDLITTQLRKAIEFLTKPREINGRKFPVFERQRAYISCFSTKSNDLSQWRGYAGSKGVALGFNYPLLSTATPDAFLAPVLYDNESGFTETLLEDISEIRRSLQTGDFPEDQTINQKLYVYFVERYLLLLPLMKSDFFQSENEWRLVLTEAQVIRREALWSSRPRYAVPYIELQLKGELHKAGNISFPDNCRCKVVLGPEAHPLAMHYFDHRLGITSWKESGISFRS